MRSLVYAAALGVMTATATTAAASCPSGPPTTIVYDIANLDYAVSNVIHFNDNPGCSAGRGGTFNFGTGSTSFGLNYGEPQQRLFLLGTAQDLPGDSAGQKHLVIFSASDWAQSAQGIAFGTLFPTVLEDQLIAALEDAATGNGQQSSYDLIDNFWFNAAIPAGVTFGADSTFSAIAFSHGLIIGNGTTMSFNTPNGVPEPASWALLIAGFGLVGAVQRRRAVTVAA